eukprot:863614_1
MSEKKQNNNGCIEWKVTGNLLQQFKNAKFKQAFYSPRFKTNDGTIWRIQFYPSGYVSEYKCSIYLTCVKLNDYAKEIGVNFSFSIPELDWAWDTMYTFNDDDPSWGAFDPFRVDEVNDLDVMTINCLVEETMDVSDENTHFEWKVTKYLMKRWKIAKYKKEFWSPYFNSIGANWYMGIAPNGLTTEGAAYLYIWCNSINSDEQQIEFCHYIAIESLNHHQTCFESNKIEKDGQIKCNSPFKFHDIQNQSEITIRIKIWRPGSFNQNPARLLSNIYLEKMDKLNVIHHSNSMIFKTNLKSQFVLKYGDQDHSIKTQRVCYQIFTWRRWTN